MAKTDMSSFVEYPPGSGILIGNFGGDPWGEIAKVVYDSDGRIQCHCCGETYEALGSHLYQAHGINTDKYREAFELNRTLGLISKRLRRKQSEIGRKAWPLRNLMESRLPDLSKRVSAAMKGRPQRRQSVLANQAAHPMDMLTVECVICGTPFSTQANQGRNTCSDICRRERRVQIGKDNTFGEEFWAGLNQHPKERKSFIEQRALARQGPRFTLECPVCGNSQDFPIRYEGKFKTCGKQACRRTWLSRIRTGKKHTKAARLRMSVVAKRRHAIEGGLFGGTPPPRFCDVGDCGGNHVARGLCRKHYERAKRQQGRTA